MQAATGLADRLLVLPGDDHQRLVTLYLITFGREPTADEQQADREFLARLVKPRADGAGGQGRHRNAWATLCHVMLAANEFIYLR